MTRQPSETTTSLPTCRFWVGPGHDGVVTSGSPQHTLSNKIFGIGLARTGTTSLHEAMGVLGLLSAPDSIPLLDSIDIGFLQRHDAFFDNPIPFRYEALETVCPDSKWIVTQRPVDDWLSSMDWLFGPGLDRLKPDMRRVGDRVHRQLYGSDQFDEDRLRALYERHYAQLHAWADARNGRDVLWINVEHGFSWEPLCTFLGVPIPEVDFPHANRRQRRRFGTWRSVRGE